MLTREAAECRLPHHGAIEVFSRIHQRKKSAQNAGFDLVGHRETTGSHMYQSVAAPSDLLHQFVLPLVAVFSQRGFTPHLGAFLLDEKREMKNAQLLRGKSCRHSGFAPS